jgi:formyltetrahydrofolate deformylase
MDPRGPGTQRLMDDGKTQAGPYCLVVHGPDRPGIVAAVSGVLSRHGANIVALDQHSDDPDGGAFFQRTVAYFGEGFSDDALQYDLAETVSDRLGLHWRLRELARPTRVALLASKSDHCLLDLLWRHRRGEIPMSVEMVISNHTDCRADVDSFGVPFFHVPAVPGPDKSTAESAILDLVAGKFDLVVLARYMQILSPRFLDEVGAPVINIHHSFLPAFIGAAPYRQARRRGVKLIGATAHYVTAELDEGPIIEQDVVRVSHRDSTAELTRRGADIERQVLSRAVRWHCQERVIRHNNQTIVF